MGVKSGKTQRFGWFRFLVLIVLCLLVGGLAYLSRTKGPGLALSLVGTTTLVGGLLVSNRVLKKYGTSLLELRGWVRLKELVFQR